MSFNAMLTAASPAAVNGTLQRCRCAQITPRVGGARHAIGRQGPLAIVARLGTPKRGADIVKTQADLRKERREQFGDGNIWEAVVESHQRLAQDVDIKKLLGTAFVIGVTFGTAFQPTHNNGFLPVYDVLPFQVGPFLQSGLVPLVLAPIWVLYGYLQPLLDNLWPGDEAAIAEAERKASSLGFLAADWTFCAVTFILSDILYLGGASSLQISATLGLIAALNWKLFDGTKPGLLLGALLAVGAPASEMVIVNVLGWWHYDRPDLLGVPHWAGWCYAAYAWGVGNVGRYLVQKQKMENAGAEIKGLSTRR